MNWIKDATAGLGWVIFAAASPLVMAALLELIGRG